MNKGVLISTKNKKKYFIRNSIFSLFSVFLILSLFPAFAFSAAWVASTIDSDDVDIYGEHTSIAIDSGDKVHISYFDSSNGDLKYVTNASGSWVASTIDSDGIVGEYTSIAIDSGDKVHISYFDFSNKDLKYAYYDNDPPTVISTSPVSDATGVPLNTIITATFSEAMDETTIDNSTFTLSGGVTGTVTYDAGIKTATFTPSSNLAANTSYTVTITKGVKDVAENNMASDYTWNFITIQQYTLNITKDGTGTGTITSSETPDPMINCGATCSASYDAGSSVTLTASADTGSSFAGWSGGGCSGTGQCVITINSDTTVTATFSKLPVSWKDPVSGNWSDPTKWTGGTVPTSDNDVSITVAGTYTVTLDVNATVNSLTLGGASGTQTLSMSGPVLTLNNSSSVQSNGVFNLNGGTLTGSGVLTVNGTLNWIGGTMSGTGMTNIPAGGTLNIGGGVVLNTRTLNNSGTAIWTSSSTFFMTGATFNNLPGAVFDIQNNSTLYYGGGTATFNNSGTVKKTAGTGTTQWQIPLNNTGTVEVDSGKISITGSLTTAVTNISIGGTTPMTQYGQLAVSGAATLAGILNISLINGFEPSIGDSFTIINYGSKNGVFSTTNLSTLTCGKLWNITYSDTSITLSVDECVQGIINGKVSFVVSGTSYSSTPVEGGPAGTFTITAVLKNTSAVNIYEPINAIVKKLTNGNLLLSATEGDGSAGSKQAIDAGSDDILTPGESVTVQFVIGLAIKKSFSFYVDVEGCIVP